MAKDLWMTSRSHATRGVTEDKLHEQVFDHRHRPTHHSMW